MAASGTSSTVQRPSAATSPDAKDKNLPPAPPESLTLSLGDWSIPRLLLTSSSQATILKSDIHLIPTFIRTNFSELMKMPEINSEHLLDLYSFAISYLVWFADVVPLHEPTLKILAAKNMKVDIVTQYPSRLPTFTDYKHPRPIVTIPEGVPLGTHIHTLTPRLNGGKIFILHTENEALAGFTSPTAYASNRVVRFKYLP
ncbi:MAG: hypothetical protein Harvfovirus6_1 [Harvfovirus sp.]|uniref:Uncharacterized protein n=1 Tax=Harvfovirus sp. TaxID=2487768 RepID=A0A3G5A3I4_9VIRU|nr:MAG: hypothetical protein Harvfovirus6_1 [Harvfovirus sp.]